MNFKKFLRSILLELDVPTYYMTNHNSNDNLYIVYSITSETETSASDNDFESIKYSVNIRVFSKGDFDNLVSATKRILKQNNFKFVIGADDYDSTTNYYCQSMYFEYIDFFYVNNELDDELIDPDFSHPYK